MKGNARKYTDVRARLAYDQICRYCTQCTAQLLKEQLPSLHPVPRMTDNSVLSRIMKRKYSHVLDMRS